jgi:hypothetical protein
MPSPESASLVCLCLQGSDKAFDWGHLVKETLRLEGIASPAAEQMQERERRLRNYGKESHKFCREMHSILMHSVQRSC